MIKILYDFLIIFLLIYAIIDIASLIAEFIADKICNKTDSCGYHIIVLDKHFDDIEFCIHSQLDKNPPNDKIILLDINAPEETRKIAHRIANSHEGLFIMTKQEASEYILSVTE